MATRHVRDILRDMGYKDSEIGWNPTTKKVTLRGKDFDFGGTNVDGRIMTTEEAVRRALGPSTGTPKSSGSGSSSSSGGNLSANDILRIVQQQSQGPDISAIMREVERAINATRPPQIDFARAMGQVQSSLAPYAEAAQREMQQQNVQALRALQAQQAMAGVAGSPAQRATQQLTEAQARAVSDLTARLQAMAAEQALGVIGAQTDRYRTQAAAEAAAQQLAQSIYSELAASQRAQQQNLLSALLGLYQTQSGERQAMLPYTYAPITALLPYMQPTQTDVLQFVLDLLSQTGGDLSGLGLN